ncbi:MAG TPA: hypothetical protein VNF05_08890 [Acidimicrobiales bacterium]|nr:hypothetical protein [Acidimicrobiales bacterium]
MRVSAATSPSTTTTTIRSSPVKPPVNDSSASRASTIVRHAPSSSSGTASNVKPVANAPGENASSGVLTGQIDPSFAVADVPLDGPGTWSVVTSAAATLTLRCENQSISVQAQFVIGARERCQLIIVPSTPSTSMTWQLTPVN